MFTNWNQKPRALPKIAAFTCLLAAGALAAPDKTASGKTAAGKAAPTKLAPKKSAAAPPTSNSAKSFPPGWTIATATQRTGAAGSIRAQLEAFKAGQWDKAISYQSAGLRDQFPSTQAFQQMMEKSYPQFVKFKKIEFGRALANGNLVQVAVKLTGGDNIIVRAIYIMAKEKGTYRVEGVQGGVGPDMSRNTIV